jgi:hypothetical protein
LEAGLLIALFHIVKCRKHKQIANFLYHNYTYLGYKINKKIVKNLAIYGGKFVIICA